MRSRAAAATARAPARRQRRPKSLHRGTKSSIRAQCTTAGRFKIRVASRRKAALRALLSTRWTRRPAVSARTQAITSPGKPPPLPRSSQVVASGASRTSCSESAMWRVHSVPTVDEATRLTFRCHVRNSPTKRSSSAAVSRETGVRISAARRSALKSGSSTLYATPVVLRGFRMRAASNVKPAGVMPSRRAACPIVRGRAVCSFCRTSVERPWICS